jgi:DNA-binding transcriptional ArsR family regulator/cyclopropane fatty-acyl-phospholipid synthase-like methyltransferase
MATPQRISTDARLDSGAHGFAPVVAVARAVGDGLRANVLRLLKDESYGVLELCRLLDIAQPGLSHHLKILHRAGLVTRRREGNTIFYRRAPAPPPLHDALHRALLEAIDAVDLPAAQRARIDAVHQDRSRRSEAFFAEHADQFGTNQARISEASVYVPSVLEIVERFRLGSGTALEIGPGEGELLRPLAERFDHVVAIDSARGMLEHSAGRVADLPNVRLLHQDVATLPEHPDYQLVVAAMVVHHLPSPQRFFRQAQRLLQRGGLLVIVELCRHQHEWAHTACGDLWLGFEAAELAQWAANAGFGTGETQFLAQKNGFRIQLHTYCNDLSEPPAQRTSHA